MTMVRSDIESLRVTGKLAHGQFQLDRCYSTRIGDYLPRENCDCVIETFDANGSLMDVAGARIDDVCVFLGEPMQYLVASIPLRSSARQVRLKSGAETLWEAKLLEAATIQMQMQTRNVTRSEPTVLNFQWSREFDDAFIQVFFEWAPKCSRVIDVFKPKEQCSIDLRLLPGGATCRFLAHYSNGMRSAMAASAFFELPPLPAAVRILTPSQPIELTPGQPLELFGHVLDPQSVSNIMHQCELTWLVDSEIVGMGPMACVIEPAPGEHTVTLVDSKSGNSATTLIEVVAWKTGDPKPAALWDDAD